MMARAQEVLLNVTDRERLERLVRSPTAAQKVVLRARIVLLGAAGAGVRETARELRTTPPTVMLWRGRFASGGVQAILKEAPRPGRPRQIQADLVAEVVRRTLAEKPLGATHWSTRTLAPLVTSGPPGVTGYTTGRPAVRDVFAYWPAMIQKTAVDPGVRVRRIS